jgi:hypothetical protein
VRTGGKAADAAVVNDLWTEKYRPRTRKDLIGNPGLVDRMHQWLTSWCVWRRLSSSHITLWSHLLRAMGCCWWW